MSPRVLSPVAGASEAVLSRTPLAQSSAEILSQNEHRPWPLPAGPWLKAQTWEDLLFAHWPVSVEALRPYVPQPLPLDTAQGSAWISVTPFVVSRLRTRGMPPVPWLSSFPETNVRTYTTYDGKPGVYFLSLDAANSAAVAAARDGYQLPYFRTHIDVQRAAGRVRYSLERRGPEGPPAELRAMYWPTGEAGEAPAGSLEYFLTERYCLYTVDNRGHVLRGEIHHPPWPLQEAVCSLPVNTMGGEVGIALSDPPPVAHFSRRQDVLIWPLRQAS